VLKEEKQQVLNGNRACGGLEPTLPIFIANTQRHNRIGKLRLASC